MANPFFTSPRSRRLVKDFEEMKALSADSTILEFTVEGNPPDKYHLTFHGKGLHPTSGLVDVHKVVVDLGAHYPNGLPSIHLQTPIRHPNISGGTPCFGTFHMNPHVKLTEIVEIVWDMVRMGTYNPYGGYGDKDSWQVLRKEYDFPVDKRILRDKVPVMERGASSDDVDMIIMEGASWRGARGGLPPSQQWVKKALEQYFESRGLEGRAKIFTTDEWLEAGHPEDPGDSVGILVVDKDLYEVMNAEDEQAKAFQEDLWSLFRKLGALPSPGRTTEDLGMEMYMIPMGQPR